MERTDLVIRVMCLGHLKSHLESTNHKTSLLMLSLSLKPKTAKVRALKVQETVLLLEKLTERVIHFRNNKIVLSSYRV